MKNPFLCQVILFGLLFFKMILALKSRKLLETTEVSINKFGIYIKSVPRNKELHCIRSYQKKGAWQ